MLADCLRGLRVLDLSQYLPGPYAAQILADLGAEVVKIEPPDGDPLRRLGPADADGISPFYKLINAGKTVVRLDLKAEDGKAAFADLIQGADALIESFRPGALARLRFGPEVLESLNPNLVHCALSGYGRSGPYAERAGHDLNYMALGGGLATSGTAERPVMAHPPTADYASGMQAALATLAALLRRERWGGGAFLDVSIAETVLAWQALTMTAALRDGHEPSRSAALLNGGAACYQIYRTADAQFVTLGALEPKFWAAFCRAAGRDDWIERQWEPLPQRQLIVELWELIASRTLEQWHSTFAGVDCCFEAVLEPAKLPDHPQVQARGLVRRHDGNEPLVEVLFPALLNGEAAPPRQPWREAEPEEVLTRWAAPDAATQPAKMTI